MGLSSHFKMSDLAKLAQSDRTEQLDRLFQALGRLCALKPVDDAATEDAIGQIMLILYPKVHQGARIALSGKLCKIAWASHALVLAMAQDIIRVAQPVISSSPVLSDKDLITICQKMGPEHRELIALRPNISQQVSTELIRQDDSVVLTALIENRSAKLNMESFATCVRVSRRIEPLRAKLILRSDIPRSLIPSLFAYSDEPMRRMIAVRFNIDGEHLSAVVKQAIKNKERRPQSNPDQKFEDAARMLVDKLAAAERLTSSFIVKSLNDKKIILFEHALARLAGVGTLQLRAGLAQDPLYALALGCRAARIDRSIFPVIHNAMLSAGQNIPPLEVEEIAKAAEAFGNHSPAAAAVALRLLSRNA